eukprot:5579238-Pyramimonas_sp.AAC.1
MRRVIPLNSVVLAAQKIEARVAFPAVECAGQICARSDGSFKREEETGLGMRGAACVWASAAARARKSAACSKPLAVRRLVSRSSFGSELLAACGAADGLQVYLPALRKMVRGPVAADEISEPREVDGVAVPAPLV